MLLHGSNRLLPLGTILSSAADRGTLPTFGESHHDSVYVTDTAGTASLGANRPPDEVEVVLFSAAQGSQEPDSTRALLSAIHWAVFAITRAGVDFESRSMWRDRWDIMYAYEGWPPEDASVPSPMDLRRINRNLAELEELSGAERCQAEGGVRLDAVFSPGAGEPLELRGYWVYEVVPLSGLMERDQGGFTTTDLRVRGGRCRVVDLVVADGVPVTAIPLPVLKASIPTPTSADVNRIAAWRSLPTV